MNYPMLYTSYVTSFFYVLIEGGISSELYVIHTKELMFVWSLHVFMDTESFIN
jgi:hypothetical protein